MKRGRLLKSQRIYRSISITSVTILIVVLSLSIRLTSIADQTQVVITSAVQNLQADPRGRVVDVTFDQPVTLSFPDDNARFEINIARPLGRDICFSVGDLNGDGIADLFGSSMGGATYFYPGLDSHPFRFGKAQFVRELNGGGCPYIGVGGGAVWEGSGIADFDGDGVKDVVVGWAIYTMVTPNDPTLMKEVHRLEIDHAWDVFPSVGDLDGDGKPDIVTTATYLPRNAYLHRNQSTPGNFSFQRELLTDHYRPDASYEGTRGLSVVDLNNDGLLDLISFHWIYFNQGTETTPVFDFDNPTSYTVIDGPWVDGVHSDQAISIFMHDGDGDGLVDAYVSNYGTSIWQGSFYKNIGTTSSPSFKFQSPILCHSTPYDNSYRGHTTPSFSPERAYVSTGDINRDGLLDILVSDGSGGFSHPAVLWNRSSGDNEPHFSCRDIYTFFNDEFPDMDPNIFFPNILHDLTLAWKDYTGDGLEDIIRTDGFMQRFDIYFLERKADYPVRFYTEQRLKTVTGADMKGIGLAEFDMDNDGSNDFIFGLQGGKLAYHRNLGTNYNLIFDDRIELADLTETPIDVGTNSWPVEFDWDGDGDFDLLVGEQSGKIWILLNEGGKFFDNGYLGAEGWDPLDLSDLVGGSVLTPSLDTADLNNDQLIDVLGAGFSPSCVWYFKNIGTATLPSFTSNVISVDRTIPGYVEKLSDYTYRLYFGIPVLPEETSVFFYENLTENQPAICQISTASELIAISGNVKEGDEALPGVTLTFSNEGGETTTDTNGDYSHNVSYGWSGTVTPTKPGYSFSPSSWSYTYVTSDHTDQDYTATLLTYTLTTSVNPSDAGTVTKNPDKVSYDHGESVELTANANEGYAFNEWSGNVPQGQESDNPITITTDSDKTITANFSSTIPPHVTISGSVKTSGGKGIEEVTITFSGEGGTATTDSDGNYSHNVSYGWSGTAAPSKAGYTFLPPSRKYENVTSDQTGQDYTATLLTYTISGNVSLGENLRMMKVKGGQIGEVESELPQNNQIVKMSVASSSGRMITQAGLSGVVMSGFPGNPTTDDSGNYSATVEYGWSGTVTPTKEGYAFSPSSRNYTNIISDQTDHNYSATAITPTISGTVETSDGTGIVAVTITFSNGGGTTTTDSNGNYSFKVNFGWSGNARPTKAGYSFSPSNRTYTNVTSDQLNQDYTGSIIQYTLTIVAIVGGTTEPSPGIYTYNYGTDVSITATAHTGYRFSSWTGDVPSGHENDNPVTITMDSDKTITPNFIRQYTLTIVAGTGGTTNPAPGGHPCDSGTQVSVTAVPSSGYQFSGWSGDASGSTNPVTITMDSNKSITANFTVAPSEETGGGDGGGKKGGCFIATAAYGSPLHPHLDILRDFRDKYLMRSKIGRMFVRIYYKYSPFMADLIAEHKALKNIIRVYLLPAVGFSYSILYLGPAITGLLLVLIALIPVFLFGYIKKILA